MKTDVNEVSFLKLILLKTSEPGPEVIRKKFVLNSAEHEIFPAYKC